MDFVDHFWASVLSHRSCRTFPNESFWQTRVSLEFVARYAGLSHSVCDFEGGGVCVSLDAVLAVSGAVFWALPPRLLFHKPFVGGASVVVPRCCRQSCSLMALRWFRPALCYVGLICFIKGYPLEARITVQF